MWVYHISSRRRCTINCICGKLVCLVLNLFPSYHIVWEKAANPFTEFVAGSNTHLAQLTSLFMEGFSLTSPVLCAPLKPLLLLSQRVGCQGGMSYWGYRREEPQELRVYSYDQICQTAFIFGTHLMESRKQLVVSAGA